MIQLQYFTNPLTILLLFLVLVLFLRVLQYLYLLQELQPGSRAEFEWIITEHSTSCFYSSAFVFWKIASCDEYPIGTHVRVIGIVDTSSDYGFYSKKRLTVQSIHHLPEMPVSVDDWLPFLSVNIAQLRESAHEIVLSNLSNSSGGFVLSLVLGSRAQLDPSLRRSFETTGTLHILAVSGLHVSLVLGLFDRLLSQVLSGKVKGVVLWVLVTLYVLMVGLKPSVLRAWGMLSAALCARYLVHRHYKPFSALFMTSCVLAIARPDWLAHPGFQLSVLATASIILFSKQFQSLNIARLFPEMIDSFDRTLEVRSKPSAATRILQAWKGSLAVSVAAQIVTLPLVLWHFGSAPALGFLPGSILTLAVGPVLSALFILVMVMLPLEFLGLIEVQLLISRSVDLITAVFIGLLQVFAEVDWAMITIS